MGPSRVGRDHDAHLADLSVEDVASIARTYRDRIVALHRDPRLRYVLFSDDVDNNAMLRILGVHGA